MHDELYQHLFLKNGTVYYLFFYNIANAICVNHNDIFDLLSRQIGISYKNRNQFTNNS